MNENQMIGEIGNFLHVKKEDMVTLAMPKDVRDEILVLIEAGVFNVQYGRATLNFAEGKIAAISIEKRTYDRKDIHSVKPPPP